LFIELTDILRCPEPHEESFLILVPHTMDQRSVTTGFLGCPICRREYPIANGSVNFIASTTVSLRLPAPPHLDSPEEVDASALGAFLGLVGPGGYVGMVGDVARHASALARTLPGIHLVAVNPPDGIEEQPMLSLLLAPMIPIKSRSLRAVMLGAGYGDASQWQEDAGRVVLPGLRVVGQGAPPHTPGLAVLASAADWWVAERERG
jgi:uncharacterized protein YbaR (Trm112 family)